MFKISGLPCFASASSNVSIAECRLHRDRHAPRQNPATEPVEHHSQIDKAARHEDVRDVHRQVRSRDRRLAQQIRIWPGSGVQQRTSGEVVRQSTSLSEVSSSDILPCKMHSQTDSQKAVESRWSPLLPDMLSQKTKKWLTRIFHILLTKVGISLILFGVVAAQAASNELLSSEIPPQAAAVHYIVHTFSSTFSANQVDITNTSKSGFKWYPCASTKLSSIDLNTDESVTLLGDTTGPNAELATASWTGTPGGFVGTAFGGGGYFEATFKFDPQDVLKNNFEGWPSWWSMAIEHMAGMDTRQWPGQQNGYEHFIEADFFEYDLKDYVLSGKWNYFGGAIHDWFGLYNGSYDHVIPPHSVVVREVPINTDFTQYHRYGFLWVPATATRNGYAEYYFDNRKVGRTVGWRQYTNQEPPPRPPWTFSIIDKNHLVLILGTGVNEPMTVMSVNVWQTSDDQNMKQ